MDLDTDEHLLPAGSTGPNLNIRLYNPLTQASGVAETIPGHRELPSALPDTGENEVIGGCAAEHLDCLFYFVWNSGGRHSLCRFNCRTQVATLELEWAGLNLSREHRIHSAQVVEQTIYWTDNRNEPRKLNLEHLAAEPALYERLRRGESHFLDLLRRGPQYPLTAGLRYDDTRAEQQLLPRRALQFTYRYVYVHGETSVFAPYSAMLPFKPVRPYFNVADLVVPATEQVGELVKTVELAVRIGDTGSVRVIASLPRAQVLGQAAHAYYGDVAGEAVESAAVIKPYDYVPRRSRALGYTSNRLFLAGNEEGQERPRVALTVTPVTDSLPTAPQDQVYCAELRFDAERGSDRALPIVLTLGYFLLDYAREGHPYDYYYPISVRNFGLLGGESSFLEGWRRVAADAVPPGSPLYRDGVAATGILDYRQARYTAQELQALAEAVFERLKSRHVRALVRFELRLTAQPNFPLRESLGQAANRRVFKANSVRRVGVQFYDWAGRTPGVSLGVVPFQVGGRMEHTLPLADGIIGQWPSGVPASAADPLTTGLRWQLSSLTAPLEIPAWAASYALVGTPDLTASTFTQGVSCDGGYGSKDKTGQIVFKTQQYRSDHEYTLLNIANLYRQGLGYSFKDGDRVRVWARPEALLPENNDQTSGAGARVIALPAARATPVAHDVEVIAVIGNYLVLPLVNIGTRTKELYDQPPLDEEQDIPNLRVPYEIYTPYLQSETEPFYELSDRYPVVTDEMGRRAYGVTTGVVPGDAYLVLRRDYLLEGRIRAYQNKNVDGTDRSPATGLLGVTTADFTADTSDSMEEVNRLLVPDQFVLEIPIFRDGLGQNAVILVESPNPDDSSYTVWDKGLGRVTAELRDIKVEDKYSAIRFSNVFTQGAATNGLSSFEPLNEEVMPRETGPIRKLQAVRGNLLVIQELGAQVAYVGQAQLQDTNGKTLISISDRVIGSHRPLDGGLGTQHPETIRQLGGYVYGWDCIKGVAWRYANDGMTEISGYGLVGYFGNRRRAQLAAEPRPMAWFDRLHKEYVLHLGTNRTEEASTRETLVRDQFLRAPAATSETVLLAQWLVATGASVAAGQVVGYAQAGEPLAARPGAYGAVPTASVNGTLVFVLPNGTVVTPGQVVAIVRSDEGVRSEVRATIAGTVSDAQALGRVVYAGITGLLLIEGVLTDLVAPAAGVIDQVAAAGTATLPGGLLAGITRSVSTTTVTNAAGPGDPGPAAAFCEALNRWTSFYGTYPDYAFGVGGSVVSFRGSRLFVHDAAPADAANLLGERQPAYLTLSANDQAPAVKVFQTLALEGSAGWLAPELSTPEGQASYLEAEDFDTQEGEHYAAFLRDVNTPNVEAPLLEGDALRSTRLRLRLRHPLGADTSTPSPVAQLRAARVGYVRS